MTHSRKATAAVARARNALKAMDVLNYAWTIICNVSEGDWTKQRQEWQDAAARCRDQYHALLAANPSAAPSEEPIPAKEQWRAP